MRSVEKLFYVLNCGVGAITEYNPMMTMFNLNNMHD